MACDPLYPDPFVFPRRADNRPGLPHVAYRIARYPEFVQAMRREIDGAVELAAWTHRRPDDPGIALLEGAAIVGDILSFYQEHYANEAWLRTAQWRESVADLVRLTGYRLAPGLGGRATFAVELRGSAPVTIAAGWPVRADLQDVKDPANFQTEAELVALPALGRFHLYRRRVSMPTIAAGTTTIELTAVGGRRDALSLAGFDLKKGDTLLLMPDEGMVSTPGTPWRAQDAPQFVKVAAVRAQLGRILVDLDTGPGAAWSAPARAWRVGRSFRHFGHNAPPTLTLASTDGSGNVNGSTSSATHFERYIYYPDSTYGFGSSYTALDRTEMALDVEVPDFAAGRTVLVQGRARFDGQTVPVPFITAKTVTAVRQRTLQWGNVVGAATVLTLDDQLFANGSVLNEMADIRDLRFHEVTSAPLTLAPLRSFAGGAFSGGTRALYFYGTADQARPLAGRRLHLQHDDGRSVDLVCTNATEAFSASGPASASPRMWPLSFDRAPEPFVQDDFDEASPTVTVFGNLVDATQGKAEREAALGNGDATQVFQTFALPASPLTYFLSSAATPPQQPELEVRVNGRLWTQVDAFFGRSGADEIYIVREDAEGRSYVQFGDGATGARLPTGLKNVVATFRTGSGARGPIKAGAVPTAPERPPGFDKVTLAGIVSGGADPEDAGKARTAAPGKVQSLGRIVSLADHETETLAIPGVVTARARWELVDGIPAVLLLVLLEAGREAEFEAVRAAVAHAQRCRGPNRHPVVVQQAFARAVFLDLAYARDPVWAADDVAAAIQAALGLAGEAATESTGLFGLRARALGDREYTSRVEGRVQNVTGVLWCKVTAFGRFAPPAPGMLQDPAALLLPPLPRTLRDTLPCAMNELLQLNAQHLTLGEQAEPSAGECA